MLFRLIFIFYAWAQAYSLQNSRVWERGGADDSLHAFRDQSALAQEPYSQNLGTSLV
jgi:hypothetical protein